MGSPVATKPRLGFLGLGWMGAHRLEAVRASGLAEVAGLADPVLGGELDSLDDLLELPLDGVVIATPSALHAEQATACLEHGLAVFCQKPLARTEAEAARVVDAARSADRLLGVDLSYRHAAAFLAAREVVRSGEVGEIFAADLVFHNAYGPDRAWFYDPELSGGGCVIDLGTHLVDLALWTLDLDRFEQVESRLAGSPVERYAVAQLDGVRLACSWGLHAGRDAVVEARFHGTEGGVAVRNVGGSYYDFVAERYRGSTVEVLAEPPDDWGGRAVVEWTRKLGSGGRFDPEVARAIEVARTIDRIYGRNA